MKITRNLYPDKKYWDDDFELQVMCENLELDSSNLKILDLGCMDSYLADALHDLGYETWGIDLRYYHNPKFKYIHNDFLTTELPNNYFDIVIDISALHHFGIGYLEELKKPTNPNGDVQSAKKVYNILKSNGLFYITMDRFQTPTKILPNLCWQYTTESFLNRITKNFKILELKYYIPHYYPLTTYKTSYEAETKGTQLFAKLQKI